MKDYAIYFLTLVLGVAIFYMFNSLDSQQAMLEVSQSTKDILELMITMLGMVSVFVSVILGLLIVYANNFLINRRKKEFGIYMTLGMGKWKISKIILMETLFVGMISLAIGIAIGIFASQFMSIFVAKLFEADMSEFTFVFSKNACMKTCLYFAVMYAAVMVFNTFTISRYRLINLLNAAKKNEKVKMKNPILSLAVFLLACVILGYAYRDVVVDTGQITDERLLKDVLMGIAGTVLVFWSLSGFILRIVQTAKRIYLKGTNMFVLRQLNNKINTTVISMSVICLMLFLTITILSSSLSMRNTMRKDLLEMAPADINLMKEANLPKHGTDAGGKKVTHTKAQISDSKKSITKTLTANGFDINLLKDVIEISIYEADGLTWEKFFEENIEEVKAQFPMLAYEHEEPIVKLSDYNRVAKLYGQKQYLLGEDEYIVLCNYDAMAEMRNIVLADRNPLEIAGKTYHSKYRQCQDGFLEMATSHVNTGILLVPDSCPLTEAMKSEHMLIANYNADTEEGKAEIEKFFADDDSALLKNLKKNGIEMEGISRISIIEGSVGLTAIVTFIAIYLGIIFLIASAAVLALKQLTESSDSRQRYAILRKIGCEERMISRTLFRQIGIFFALPLLVAVVHSIFGIQFAVKAFSAIVSEKELLPSIIATVIIIIAIYGAYFLATYFGSKNIIKEEI